MYWRKSVDINTYTAPYNNTGLFYIIKERIYKTQRILQQNSGADPGFSYGAVQHISAIGKNG